LPSDFKPLIGTDEATLDEKGRLMLGRKKRERLGETFALVHGPKGCLVAYPAEIWKRLTHFVLSVDPLNEGREDYSSLILAAAEDDLRFDAQGRVVVPQWLRERARIKDKVVLIGAGDHLQIWAKSEYEAYLSDKDGYERERREAVKRAYNLLVGRDG